MTKVSSMPSTLRSKARGHNALRVEHRRPPPGGREYSAGATRRPMGARYARSVLRRRELLIDAGIAALVFAASLGLLAGGGAAAADEEFRGLDSLGVALAAVASLPLLARRRAPLATFALTAAASAALNGLGYPLGPPLGPTVALYFVALSPEKTRASRWLTGGLVAGFYVIHAGAGGVAEDEFPTLPLLFCPLVW